MIHINRKTFFIGALLVLGLLSTVLVVYFYFDKADTFKQKNAIPQMGQEYESVTHASIVSKSAHSSPVTVIYFFAYDCVNSRTMSTKLERWLSSLPSNIEFEEIPINDGTPQGYYLEKVHYLAQLLDQPKMTYATAALIFKWLYIDQKDLSDGAVVKNSFIQQGVASSAYEAAQNFPAGINAYIRRGRSLQKNYKIQTVPTVIIGGRYMTNLVMTNNDFNRFFKVMIYLINTVKKENNQLA